MMLGINQLRQDNINDAEVALKECVEIYERVADINDWQRWNALVWLGESIGADSSRRSEAE